MRKILLAGIALGAMIASAYADTYVVSMKGPAAGNPYWAAFEEGAKAKGKELGVDVQVVSPPSETDVQAQISQIEDLIAQKVAGIALAPTDPAALAPVVDEAKTAGINVVFVDGAGTNKIPFIGTDNLAGGKLGGEFMCKKLPAGSEVAILQGVMSTTNGADRYNGAKAALEGCGMKVVAAQPADWDRAKGQSITETILAGNPNIKGIFGSNDNMALGAVEALKAASKLKDVMVVGYDANPDAANSILAGELTASVAQAPKKMAALGIQALVDLKAGKQVPMVTDPGTVLVTKENAEQYK
ncbi:MULTISPECIES: sugar ABC transporter substrate-binding protein [unclassified Mesorhizobium]|uniref:sugar ABC transporter substrate-binding protein n=1 Tax=unclassified Mesorhizobium TaxID=325217 RepID=UPI001129C1D7|nr:MULTISPECIES: sugar ABC transporter substrate-binding protein [unclassified Mesorhizobium]TPJ30201.1 sugar ABC transporter substrate-binding protein [Mesorhizobium sp. B2-7-2]TPJ79143.1 sugar ABC transporter substrate-binding protein [Mesorhizobium sp. B2-6-2]